MADVLVQQHAFADASKCISQAKSADPNYGPDVLRAEGSLAEVRDP